MAAHNNGANSNAVHPITTHLDSANGNPQTNRQTSREPESEVLDSESDDELPEDVADAEDEVENYVPSDLSGLKTYDGYDKVGFQQGDYVPPPEPLPFDQVKGTTMEFGKGADISHEEAREALLEYVLQNRCFGKSAAENMKISGIMPTHALHYTLETFREGRTTARNEVPYDGESTVGPNENATPPKPWDMKYTPENHFYDHTHKMPVPHTDEIRSCGMCRGIGFVKCAECKGYGKVKCTTCDGEGSKHTYNRAAMKNSAKCKSCVGKGRRKCQRCSKSGKVGCSHCKGAGKVRNYIELTITYVNDVKDFILEETDMPDHLVRDVSGIELFQQTLPQVEPIKTFSVHHINENSIKMVDDAKAASPAQRQICQRQTLRAVPVSEVAFTYKDKSSVFWVYGKERRVCAPDYPQQCCWGCTIL